MVFPFSICNITKQRLKSNVERETNNMRLVFLNLLLALHSFGLAEENLTTGIFYRFEVYPVDSCPMNKSQFDEAAKRMNCSRDERYLCSPDRNLTSLIEFCTDISRSLYENGNCLRLEGTGHLNHYNCEDKFIIGCPNASFADEEIYKYPACLEINTKFNCFVADKRCNKKIPSTVTTKPYSNATKNEYAGKQNNTGTFKRVLIFSFYSSLLIVTGIGIGFYIKQKSGKTDTDMDKDLLNKFLGKGDMPIRHVRCIIVGCGGAGKTTLLRRLQNANFKELKDIKSTELVDVHVNCFDVLEEKNTIQSVKRDDRIPAITFPTDFLEKDYRTTDTNSLPRVAEECTEDSDQTANKETLSIIMNEDDVEESACGEHIDNAEEKINLTELLEYETSPNEEENHVQIEIDGENIDDVEKHAIMNAANCLSYEKRICPRVTFLDFAGQSLYYAFHQIYLSPKTCYILVVDMTKRFDGQVPVDEKCCSRFNGWTYEDYYKFWLKSIDSYSDKNTPVILVGTHAEHLSKQDCCKFFQDLFALFDNHPDLRRHLHEDRKFAIGYPKTGETLTDLKDIKTCIANIVRSPAFFDMIQPVWAIFEYIMRKEKSRKIIKRNKISHYNTGLSEEFKMTDDNITEMLLFFHKVGNCLYFDKVKLKETIILDVQWFLDAFKCLISYEVNIAQNDCKRLLFKTTGEMDDKELLAIWETNKEGRRYLLYKTEILSYMEQLGLLAICFTNNDHIPMYYFPSMNKRRFKNPEKNFKKSSILCFEFDKNGQLPFYTFYCLVVKCLTISDWSILQENEKNCLYENVACFSYRHCIVVVCLCKFQIQVQVWIPEKEGIIDTVLLNKIQRSLEEKISEIKNNNYNIGYKCQNGMLNAEEDNSFIALKEFPVSNFTCQRCALGNKHYVDNNICWVASNSSGKDVLLADQYWYYGVLPRREVEQLLTRDGDFLVRESKNQKTNEPQYVLSTYWEGHLHFPIRYNNIGWRFDGRSFPTISELVNYHHISGEPVTTKSQAILKNAILREQWQLRNDDINLEMKIGNGCDRDLYRGKYKPKGMMVVVETCNDSLFEDEKNKFLQKMRILKQYDHPNIVKFIGIATQRQPVMIVMENVEHGVLLTYLRNHGKSLSQKQQTKMCEDVASGMAYLESKNCIHRYLAARNCLVGDKLVVKISNFMMSRQEKEYTLSDGLKRIPVKWTAPEALNFGTYTSLCDVWSFGILIWEIFSSGVVPYSGMTSSEAKTQIDRGYRMPAPMGTPEACHDLMMKCWQHDPSERDHFDRIKKELHSIYKSL